MVVYGGWADRVCVLTGIACALAATAGRHGWVDPVWVDPIVAVEKSMETMGIELPPGPSPVPTLHRAALDTFRFR